MYNDIITSFNNLWSLVHFLVRTEACIIIYILGREEELLKVLIMEQQVK